MSGTLKLDGYDLWPALRIAQDAGLDPAASDFLAPQFGESAAGEGDPLLSVHAGNRTLIFPLSLNPSKLSGGYASTPDGLNQLIRDLNRRCSVGQSLQWAAEGSTRTTFYNIKFAKLNIKYDYRRQAVNWLDADLVVTCSPYGASATVPAVVATAAGSGIVRLYPSAPDGDAPAKLTLTYGVPSKQSIRTSVPSLNNFYASGLDLVGYTVTTPSNPVFVPAASLSPVGVATLIGASGAIGSQAQRMSLSAGFSGLNIATIANLPEGRHRALMSARWWNSVGTFAASMYMSMFVIDGVSNLEPAATVQFLSSTSGIPPAFSVFDMGVVTIDYSVGTYYAYFEIFGSTGGQASAFWDVEGMFFLPEDSTTLYVSTPGPSGATYTFDGPNKLTYQQSGGGRPSKQNFYQRGNWTPLPVGTQYQVFAFNLIKYEPHTNPLSVDVATTEQFSFMR